MVEEIARLVFVANAGGGIDWNEKAYEHFHLFSVWRESERQVKQVQDTRLQWVLRSFFKEEA